MNKTHTFKHIAAALLMSSMLGLWMGSASYGGTSEVTIDLEGASQVSRPVTGGDQLPSSHFLSEARTVFDHDVGVSGFQSLGGYREVYPGISMATYSDDHHFEFSFILAAGADPSQIQLKLNNVKTEGFSSQGDIVYSGEGFEAYQHAPAVFRTTEDGRRSIPGRLVQGLDGTTSVSMPRSTDERRDELNGTRLQLISSGGGAFGPDYDFYMSQFETTNEQLIRFLNDAEANQSNPRGENMYFDENGNVWINPEMQEERDEMFQIDSAKIEYDPDRVAGDRFHHVMDENGREPFADHPATGISWYGAVKYCNWLTIQSGRGLAERCYTEGTNTQDWAPVTATNWSEGFFGAGEREAWLDLNGFRLPMFRTYDDSFSGSTNAYNEFLKAGSWSGHTNVLYGYGRDAFTEADANALDTAMATGQETLPVGYFDGLNPFLDSRTHINENYFGVYDLTGNAAEWVNDPARQGVPDARSVCGGSYGDKAQPLAVDRITAPYTSEAVGGFRPVTTYMPQEQTEIHILYCFHSPSGIPTADGDRFGAHFTTLREAKPKPAELLSPGAATTALAAPGEPGETEEPSTTTDPGISPPDTTTTTDTTEPTVPGIVYRDPPTTTTDDTTTTTTTDTPGPSTPPLPPGPFPPTPPPLPTTYRLGLTSENPGSGVNIAVSFPDVNGQAGGSTAFDRFYYYGDQVTVTAPSTVGSKVFQYWLRNGVPFTTSLSVTIQMLGDLELTAVYIDPVPPVQRTLNVKSTPVGSVPVSVSLRDNNGNQNGTTAFSRTYDDGDTVSLTAPASAGGQDFQGWLRNGVPFSNGRSVTFTMYSDITMTATYGQPPAPTSRRLTVASENPNSGVGVNVNTPDLNGLQDGSTTFLRNYNSGENVAPTAPPSVGDKTFSHWLRNGGAYSANNTVNVSLLTDTTLTAVYVDPPSDIILSVLSDQPGSGIGIVIGTPDKSGLANGSTSFTRRYDKGTVTTVAAPTTAPNGNIFQRWLLNGIPLSTNTSISISLLADTELIAVYRPAPEPNPTYNLNVRSENPDGGVTITVSTPDIQNNTDGSTAFSRTYEEGAETILTAPETAPGGTVFDHWLIDGIPYSSSRTINIAMYANHTATAVYKDVEPPLRHVLTVESRNPDSAVVVTVNPTDVNGQQNGSTTFTRLYDDGEIVTLTARNPAFPGTSNTLKQWLLDGTPVSTNATISVIMLRDTTVTAVYGPPIPPDDHTLTVNSENSGGGVAVQISQPDLNGEDNGTTEFQRLYSYGTPVRATAPETAPNGNTFTHWLLDGNVLSTNLSVDVSILSDATLTAVYDTPPIEHRLIVDSRNPDSGVDVQISTVDNNGEKNGSTHFERLYGDGVYVALDAPQTAPNGRDVFKRWERDGVTVTTNTSASVTMYSDINMTAVYGSPDTFDLVVRSDNPDRGVNVSVSTPDIRGDTDGSTQFTRTYNPGETTTVTAEEASSDGTYFQEWLLNGVPFSTDRSITLTMLSDMELTAVYGPLPPENRWLVVRSSNPDSDVPIGIDLPDQRSQTDGQTAFVRLYQDGDTVTATAPATAGGNSFQQWILNGTPYTTNLSATVTMFQNHEMIAVYGPPLEPEDRTLVVDSRNPNSGVPITVSAPDKNGNSDGDTVFVRTYTYGQSTTLTAPVQGGTNDTTFLYWELNGTRYSDDRTITVEMLADLHLTAVYGDAPTDVTLSVSAKDSTNDNPIPGVTVSVAPADNNQETTGSTAFQRIYDGGTVATLTAPLNADGKEFQYWERDGVPVTTSQTVNVELLTDVSMTAVYGDPPPDEELTLTVRSEGPDGALITYVTTTPDNYAAAGGSTTFERHYNTGTSVTLTAPSTSDGYVFDHWKVGDTIVSNSQTYTLELLSNLTVTAVYTSPPPSASGL